MTSNEKYHQKIAASNKLIEISWILAILLPSLSVIIAHFMDPYLYKIPVQLALGAIFLFPISLFIIIVLMIITSDIIKREATKLLNKDELELELKIKKIIDDVIDEMDRK